MGKSTPRRKRLGAKIKCGNNRRQAATSQVRDGNDAVPTNDGPRKELKSKNNPKEDMKILTRKVACRDKKNAKNKIVIKKLQTKVKHGGKGQSLLRSELKEAKHNQHVERRASRVLSLSVEKQDQYNNKNKMLVEQQKQELASLGVNLINALEMVDDANQKAENAEAARINSKLESKVQLRKERQEHSESLTKLHKQLMETFSKERKKAHNDLVGLQAIAKHQSRMTEKRLDKLNIMAAQEKNVVQATLDKSEQFHRECITKEVEKNQELEGEISGLNKLIEEMRLELNESKKSEQMANKSTKLAKEMAVKRFEQCNAEKAKRVLAEDNVIEMGKTISSLAKELDELKMSASHHPAMRVMKKERVNAHNMKPGGGFQYPTWMVKAMCHLLISGVAPSAVPKSMDIMYRALLGTLPVHLPCINYVRHGRVIIEVLGETMVAIKLARAQSWDQLNTDATTRRQIPFTALIIGVLGANGVIDPMVVSSCIFTDEETSECQAEGIINKVRLTLTNTR